MGDTVLAGHDSLMEQLGFEKRYRFRFNDEIAVWKPYSLTGGDLVEALQFDLQLIDHLLRSDHVAIRSAIADAHKSRVEQLCAGAQS